MGNLIKTTQRIELDDLLPRLKGFVLSNKYFHPDYFHFQRNDLELRFAKVLNSYWGTVYADYRKAGSPIWISAKTLTKLCYLEKEIVLLIKDFKKKQGGV